MRSIRLYLDEDAMQHGLLLALQARGVAAVSALEAGLMETPDDKQLIWCHEQGRVLYSFNVQDYARIHNEFLRLGRRHSGIILAPQQRYSIGEQLRRLLKLLAAKSAEDMIDQLEFLSNWQ